MSDGAYAQIQADFGRGNWMTVRTVPHDAQYIAHAIREVANSNPEKRIRAIDDGGRLLDIYQP